MNYYDSISSGYNELHKEEQLKKLKIIKENITVKDSLLDVGCGTGFCLLEFDVKVKAGIDPSVKLVEQCDKSCNCIVGKGEELPFEDNSFDTVVSWEVLEHIPNNKEDSMFKEVFRVLKPNGFFYLSTPNKSVLSNIFDPAWWLINHRHYNKRKLIKVANRNGFSAENITLRGGLWEIIGINNLYIAKWIFRRNPFFEKYISKKQNKEYKKQGFTNIFCKFRSKQ